MTVLDLDRATTSRSDGVSLARLATRPSAGWKLRGAPVLTLVGGRIVHDAR